MKRRGGDCRLFGQMYCISAAIALSKANFDVIHPNNLPVICHELDIWPVEETIPKFWNCAFMEGESECRPPFLVLPIYYASTISKAAFIPFYHYNPLVESVRLNIGSVE